jgi:hypothetical protein
MVQQILELLNGFWQVLGEMSPYLLLGFAIAGVLSVFLSARWVERHLGGRGWTQVVKAAGLGVPLPLCSCGVIPVSASLRKQGAGRGAVTSFLISTPQTGVDSILVTYSLLGPIYAIFRPLLALVSGVLGGVVAGLAGGKDDIKQQPSTPPAAMAAGDACCDAEDDSARESTAEPRKSARSKTNWFDAIGYGFVTLPRDIGPTLLLGLVISAAITVLVPEDFFAGSLGTGLTGMLVMMALAIPVYVCATASVPIAAALVLRGASPGAALVFLMTGPATNAATVATIWKVMGHRTAIVYIASMVLCAFGGGLVLDWIVPGAQVRAAAMGGGMLPGWVRMASAIVLLGILLYAVAWPWLRKLRVEHLAEKDDESASRQIGVEGMTCSHCAQSVHDSLMSIEGVESATVSIDDGKVAVMGRHLDDSRLRQAIESLGYRATL